MELSLRLRGMSFGGAAVLGPLDLEVARGETVAVLGPSGIGKSTLLRIAAGLETRFDGTRDVPGRAAMVFQEPTLLPWRTVLANLTLTTGAGEARAREALDEVGLGGMEGRWPASLSLGQQRRLSLARAFLAEPDLLLMDEPFVSLDAALAEEMMALFEALRGRRELATLLVTHVEREAERLASRTVRLSGSPARIAEPPAYMTGAYRQSSASGVMTSRS